MLTLQLRVRKLHKDAGSRVRADCFSSNRSRSALAAVMAAVIATAVAAEAHKVCVLFYSGSWRTAPSTIGLDQPSPQGVPAGARDSIRQSTDGSKPNTLAS